MKNVIGYVHTHWDREWYREFEEFRLRLIEVFDNILVMLEKGELPSFYFDGQTCALEDYLEIYPNKKNLVKKLVKEKKLRIGPFYCSADSLLVSGECLCRNFEIGINTAKNFGETDFIGYLSDTFGHSRCMPYIFKYFNIDKACAWRGLGNYNADLLWDGIKLTNLIQGYFQDFLNSNQPIEKKAENLKKYLDKIAFKSSDTVLLPIGGDHLAAAHNLNEQINELNKIYKDYKIKISSPFEYFDKIKNREKISGEFLENNLNFILQGVYSSRIYVKQANAKSQWLLSRIAEPLQALSYLYYGTKNRQNEIDYAYKTLIKNHAHDSIYGCSIDEVMQEVMNRYNKCDCVSQGIIKRTLRDLSDEGSSLSVINLSNFKYSGRVLVETEKILPKWMRAVKISSKSAFTDKKLYNINDIPITEDITKINTYLIDVKNIDSFSLNKINKENICNENYLTASNNFIENKYIKLEIKNGKIIVTDKKKNEKYLDFIKISDRADIGDSYNFGPLKNDGELNAEIISFKLKEKNHQRAISEIKYAIFIPLNSDNKGRNKTCNKCVISVNAILYNQSEMIEFELKWENKSKNHLLSLGFNLKEKIKSTISEDLFGTVKREFNADFDIYEKIPAPKGIELKTNTAPMQRFVNAQNVTVFTKGNSEYEVKKNTLNITLLRATGIISNPKNPSRGTSAGPPLKTPELQCLGQNHSELAIAFENDTYNLFRLAEEFYMPYLTLFTDKENKKFLDIKESQLVYSVKIEQDKNISGRIFDFKSKEIKNITY